MTHGEQWQAAAFKRLASFCKVRGYTIHGPVVLPGDQNVVAIRDYTGHRVELFYTADGSNVELLDVYGRPRANLSAAEFDDWTTGLIRQAPVSKRQLILPLEASP